MQRCLRIQCGTELVEVRHLLFGAALYGATIRFDLTEDQAQHRRFTSAVRPNQADAITTHDTTAEVIDDLATFIRLRHINQIGNQRAGCIARIDAHGYLTLLTASGCTLSTQLVEPLHTEDRTRTTRFNAFTNPDLFLRQQFVGTRLLKGLFV